MELFWIVFWVSAVAGPVLLVVGLRGRRVGENPFCASCKYDLSGVKDPTTCPECGAGLSGPDAITRGVRKRIPQIVLTGKVFVTILGVMIVQYFLGTSLAVTGQSSLLLTLQAKHRFLGGGSYESGFNRIGAELFSRREANNLPDKRLKALVDACLDVHEKSRHHIDNEHQSGWRQEEWGQTHWSQLLSHAFRANLLAPSQRARYIQNATYGWSFEFSKRRLEGTPFDLACYTLPANKTHLEESQLVVLIRPEWMKINGEEAALSPFPDQRKACYNDGDEFVLVDDDLDPKYWMLARAFRTNFSTEYIPSLLLPTGDHTIEVKWRFDQWLLPSGSIHLVNSSYHGSIDLSTFGSPHLSTDLLQRYDVTVIPKPEDVLTYTTQDQHSLLRFASFETPRSKLTKNTSGSGTRFRLDHFKMQMTANEVSFDELIQIAQTTNDDFDNADPPLAYICAQPFLKDPLSDALYPLDDMGRDHWRRFELETDDPVLWRVFNIARHWRHYGTADYPFEHLHHEATLVLIPDPISAANTAKIDLLWNEPIEFPIEFDWSAIPEADRPPLPEN